MYNSSKNILTGVLCAIVIAAIAVGVLFACGVFKKDTTTGTKLPIVYPDKNINWVQVNDTTLRAAFNDKLELNKDVNLRLVFNVNNSKENADIYIRLSDNSALGFDYETWCAGGGDVYGFNFKKSNNEEFECRIILRVYNNASLSDSGDVLDGDGFVIEVADLQKVVNNADTEEETYEDVEIESFRLLSMTQESTNKIL